MAKYIINDLDALNLELEKLKYGDRAKYDFINGYFQAFLDNDSFLNKQIDTTTTALTQLKTDIEDGVVVPGINDPDGGGGTAKMEGLPIFLDTEEPTVVNPQKGFLWINPIRTTVITKDPEVILLSMDTETVPEAEENKWHLSMDEVLYKILNVAESVEEMEDGSIMITTIE